MPPWSGSPRNFTQWGSSRPQSWRRELGDLPCASPRLFGSSSAGKRRGLAEGSAPSALSTPSPLHVLHDPSFLFWLQAVEPLNGLFSACCPLPPDFCPLVYLWLSFCVCVRVFMRRFYWNLSFMYLFSCLFTPVILPFQCKLRIIPTPVLDVWLSWHTGNSRCFHASMTVKVNSALFATIILMKFGLP